MNLDSVISSFIAYGLEKGFFTSEDEIYVSNRLLHLFRGTSFKKTEEILPFKEALRQAIGFARDNRIEELDNLNQEDNLEAEIIDLMLPRPSEITRIFYQKYRKSPKDATDWYYQFSKDTDYVKTERLAKNIFYKTVQEQTELDITINLSKPEKDPKEIARLKTIKNTSYPLCALCKENEGFYGSYSQAGRSDHRIIPVKLGGHDFFFQYSPYGYFNEHCIILDSVHRPMEISEDTFRRFADFLDWIPHYLIGSNADLPIVGGSILTHEHYQGGNYVFPLNKAEKAFDFKLDRFRSVRGEYMKWPLSDLKLFSEDREEIIKACSYVLAAWRKYSDARAGIIASDKDGLHNTITPIARKVGGEYQIDLVLRNNRTSGEYPDGIFHPHKDKHHIKKENIGLIEVMGLAILPGRLISELDLCADYLVTGIRPEDPSVDKHMDWVRKIRAGYPRFESKEDARRVLKNEVGLVFKHVLDDCGVFKQDEKGFKEAEDFINNLNR